MSRDGDPFSRGDKRACCPFHGLCLEGVKSARTYDPSSRWAKASSSETSISSAVILR
jgi:hypothetical protein